VKPNNVLLLLILLCGTPGAICRLTSPSIQLDCRYLEIRQQHRAYSSSIRVFRRFTLLDGSIGDDRHLIVKDYIFDPEQHSALVQP